MNERGVSLVELCMVIAIIAIVAGVSLPGWASLVAKQQHRAVVMEIASELRMARQLAMARHERIRVVVNAEQSELRTECVVFSVRSMKLFWLLMSMSTNPEILFQPSGRSATATTIVLMDSLKAIHHVTVSITGRVAQS